MSAWRTWLEWIEPLGRKVDSWKSWLPARVTPLQTSLLAMGTFLAVTLVFVLMGRLLFGKRNQTSETEAIGSRRPLIFGSLTEALAGLIPVNPQKQERLRQDLIAAGYFHRQAYAEFMAFRNGAALLWLIFSGCAVVLLANPTEDVTFKLLIGAAVICGCILALPRILLSSQAESRQSRIRFALPDALDMINMMVAGGLSLKSSIQRAQRELMTTHPDIGCELAILDRQAEAGSMDLALRQFAKRVNVADVTVLATMVRHAEQLGGNVSGAFREFADSIRLNRRQMAEDRGNKATVKLLFPTVLCLTPPIYILLLGPAALEMKDFVQRERRPGGALSQNVNTGNRAGRGTTPTANARPNNSRR